MFKLVAGVVSLATLAVAASGSPDPNGPFAPWITQHTSSEALAQRTYFYVGGKYENATNGAGLIRTGQLYVEQLVPPNGATKKYPLVFFHGAAQTGTNWLNTPDGRQGWASYFVSQGYAVYIADQPERGRSPWELSQGNVSYFPVAELESIFTAPEAYNKYPQAAFHTQWPGTGQMGDAIFDQFYASQIQYQGNDTYNSILNREAGSVLLNAIGPVILVTHSQAGYIGWTLADAVPSQIAGLLAIEPQGPPFHNVLVEATGAARPYGIAWLPLNYSPPISSPSDLTRQTFPPAAENLTSCDRQAEPARQLTSIKEVPVMVLTSQASYHAAYDYCTVAYLQQAGVNVTAVNLTAEGIYGNGHFLFIEENNLDIAKIPQKWFEDLARD